MSSHRRRTQKLKADHGLITAAVRGSIWRTGNYDALIGNLTPKDTYGVPVGTGVYIAHTT